MNALLHWHETNPAQRRAAKAKARVKDGRVRSGCKAKPIVFEGVTYARWSEACAATGKTKDALVWAIKKAAR